MIKYIYKIRNKVGDDSDIENPIINYMNIVPQFLASVPVKNCVETIVVQEDGSETTILELNMKMYYPLWDSNTMVALDMFIKYPIMENNIIREKTDYELYLDEIYILKDGEYIENEQIRYIANPYMFGNWDGTSWIEGLDKKMEYYIQTIKNLREPLLLAYDKLAVNRANGVDNISDEDWEDVLLWRSVWLDLTDNIDLNKTIEEQIPPTLNIIKYYL